MKLPDIELRNLKDPGLLEFMDYVSIILNSGRYEFRIVTVEPDWLANEGEAVIYSAGTVRRLYVYVNGSWVYIGWSAGGIIQIGTLSDTDNDTTIQLEETNDEDIIRFDTGDTQGGSVGERATIDVNGLALTSGLKVLLDGRTGDTYWKYNSSTGYLEGWVDGSKRVEL